MIQNETHTADQMHKYVAYGRSLQGKAIRDAFSGGYRWISGMLVSAFSRRAESRLGCTECDAHA
jgi:hypothetical protein